MSDSPLPYPLSEFYPVVLARIWSVFADPDILPLEEMRDCIHDQVAQRFAYMLAVNAYAVYVLGRKCDIHHDIHMVVHDLVQGGLVAIETCAPHQLCTEWYIHKLQVGAAVFNQTRPNHDMEFENTLQRLATKKL